MQPQSTQNQRKKTPRTALINKKEYDTLAFYSLSLAVYSFYFHFAAILLPSLSTVSSYFFHR